MSTSYKDFDNPCTKCGGVAYFTKSNVCVSCVRVKAARKGVKPTEKTVSRNPDYYTPKSWGKRVTDRVYHSKMSKADYTT